MFTPDTIAAIASTADRAGIERATLLAVAEIESGGVAFAEVEGTKRPLIRFEGHYFDRRLAGAARERARAEGLAAPRAGAVRNPSGQAARWALLQRAEAIDARAARESTSWGLGQVMGAHWAWLGYRSVDALVEEASAGVEGQVRLMLRYVEKAGLMPALERRDWRAFARGYNGPAYARNRYHLRLAAAHARFAAASAAADAEGGEAARPRSTPAPPRPSPAHPAGPRSRRGPWGLSGLRRLFGLLGRGVRRPPGGPSR